MRIFSVVLTYFQLRFWYVLKQRKPGILWVRCPFSHKSPTDLPWQFYWLITKLTSVGALIHRKQTVCWISAQTKLRSIYRHKRIVICCALMKLIKRCLQFRRYSNLQLSLLFFLLFGRHAIWRIPRKRVVRRGKLWSPETLLYPKVPSVSKRRHFGIQIYDRSSTKLPQFKFYLHQREH